MEDLASYYNADRDIEQALIALKKGAQLLKCGHQGRPKVCPFRLSADEKTLIWISGTGERTLKLSSVSRIIPGQRTAVFRHCLHPEKEHLSFSLIYSNGKRSLDLICKDRIEAEIWIAGIKSLISSGQAGRSKIDGWCDGGLCIEDNKDLTSSSISDSSVSGTEERSSSEAFFSSKIVTSPDSLHVALDQMNTQVKGSSSDAFRVSVSSAPSTSSHGSAPDDCDTLGDIYIWGEVICDNYVKVAAEKNGTSISSRADVLLPRPLESSVVLDVQFIACGVRHAAIISRQGEIFCWGEESGGRLGHGVGKDVSQPCPVESLSFCNIDFVACGEFHTCAVTGAGELYTWGDGTHNAGLLGHGSNVSHWIPKRISGPLDGLHVSVVSCGPWHTALITSTGQLFTFGVGTFGVLGHGNRENVLSPKEVASLSGLRTLAVACGVWHTAAVVDVIATHSGSNYSSGKLFTWGDGDKNRLGHGDKEPRLKPTCVSSIVDYDFHKVGCGHSLTVGLTTSGLVFTMGSPVYGQLGNPQSDGKLPCSVVDKLASESVEEIACGAYHVIALTIKNEVYTWGKGANGRLGHGDVEDRKTPTPVEALKDRHVKFIACGSSYSAAICLHKWVSGAEQSQCFACKQAFGFTRKRHNCYNCGLVHCHSCSSRKAIRAALAPNPSKPYRVCDSCFVKLSKVNEAGGGTSRRNSAPRLSGETRSTVSSTKSSLPPNLDLIKQLDTKAAAKQGKKGDVFSLGRSSQVVSLLQFKDALMATALDTSRKTTAPKLIIAPSSVSSRPVSPFSRKLSPPRSATPVPTVTGLSFSKNIADSLRSTNELLSQQVHKLRLQVDGLKSRCEMQESELQKATMKAHEAMALAAEESAKCKAAKEVIKSLTAQLKDMAERLPPGPGGYDAEGMKFMYLPNGLEPNGAAHVPENPSSQPGMASQIRKQGASESHLDAASAAGISVPVTPTNGLNSRYPNGAGNMREAPDDSSSSHQDSEMGPRSRNLAPHTGSGNQVDAEWIEQYEPGVYITLVSFRDGTTDLKRVRFSRRRFGERQAETWWSENREKVYDKYNVRGSDKSTVSGQ